MPGHLDPDSVPEDNSGPRQDPSVDPTLQIKFTLIFGILAVIPFILFFFYGIEEKPSPKPIPTNSAAAQIQEKKVP